MKSNLKIGSNLTRGKTGFVLFTISIGIIVISIIAAIIFYGQKPHEIVFTCHSESTNQTFTTTAEVNLADGMDETEAITLASKVFDQAVTVDTNYILQSVVVLSINQTSDTWKITMERKYTTTNTMLGLQHGYAPIILQISWTLQATINPTNQTIQYATQMR
jgi:hypothetical protein